MKKRHLFYAVCISLMVALPIVLIVLLGDMVHPIGLIFPIELFLLFLLLVVEYPNHRSKKVASLIPLLLLSIPFNAIVKGTVIDPPDTIIDVVGIGDDELDTIIYPIPGIGVWLPDIWREYFEEAFYHLYEVFGLQFCFLGWRFLDLDESGSDELSVILEWTKEALEFEFQRCLYDDCPYPVDMLVVVNVGINDYIGCSDCVASIILSTYGGGSSFVIVHEIGHLFHLWHCPDRLCVMYEEMLLVWGSTFCSNCIEAFWNNGYADKFDYAGWLADINGDGIVYVQDIMITAIALGAYPGHERWNPIADLNGDGIVDIKDVTIVAREYGKHYTFL